MSSELGRAFLELLFPPECAACGQLGQEPFCKLCEEALERAPELSVEGLEGCAAVYVYGGPAALAVHRLKYQGRADLGRPLGAVLKSNGLPLVGAFDRVVPVPLTNRKLRARGYNQARELIRGMEMGMGVGRSASHRLLKRILEGIPQASISREDRLKNLEGAFVGRSGLEGQRVLLVDDVLTTGATASACAAALKSAGAAQVQLLALTWTPPGRGAGPGEVGRRPDVWPGAF